MNSLVIKSLEFTTSKGRTYKVIGTEYGKGREVKYAIDTVKNQEGKVKKMTRVETIKLINS